MPSVDRVPVSRTGAEGPTVVNAWRLVRDHGVVEVAVGSVRRFRDGDGYSHSRALALQLALALIPFLLALTGLAAALHERSAATVIAQSISAVSPGGRSSDALAAAVGRSESTASTGSGGVAALVIGLALSFGAATVALGQVERGANRLFGEDDDRPFVQKYRRAAALAAVVGPLFSAGFVLIVAGGPFAAAASRVWGWPTGWRIAFEAARWPVGLLLLVGAATVLLDRAPSRRQPAASWLVIGSLTALAITAVVTSVLAGYLRLSGTFGETYGPLAGVMALLIWSLLVAVALFYGVAVCAELEALQAAPADGEETVDS